MPKLPTRQEARLEVNNPYSMTEGRLIERARKKHTGRYIGQFYAGVTVSLGSLCFGLVLGWSAPEMILRWASKKREEAETYSTIGHLAPMGCCVGSLVISTLSNKKGPRKILLVLAPIQCVIWLLLSMKNETMQFILIFFCGFFSIAYIICGETLLQDCVHIGNLYHLYILFKTSTALGVLISYIFGLSSFYISYHSTVSAFLVFVQFVLLYFCKESPVFLYDKNPAKAEESLKFYRGKTNIYLALRQIKNDSEARNIDASAKYMLFKKAVYKALFIILGLYFFGAFSGYYAFIAYGTCSFYLASPKYKPKNKYGVMESSCVLGFGFFVSSLIGLAVGYKVPYGIKKLLIISMSGTTVSLIVLGIYSAILYDKNILSEYLNHPTFFLMIVNCLSLSQELAMNTYPDIVLYEYLPHQVYLWVKIFIDSFKWGIISIMIRCTFIAQQYLRLHGALFLLAAISIAGIFFCKYCVIESKGKTLLHIQMELGGNPIGSRSVFKSRNRLESVIVGDHEDSSISS